MIAAGMLAAHHMISPIHFFVLTGVGLYAAYTPLQSLLMDRLIAALRTPATASFLSALADSCGYVSTVMLYLGRNLASRLLGIHLSYAGLLLTLSYCNLLAVPACMAGCLVYYRPHLREPPVALQEALLPDVRK